MSSLHARLAGLTLLLLLLFGITNVRMEQKRAELVPIVTIAVEHATTAALTLTRTESGVGPVDIRNDSQEVLYISLPESWTRDEVRNAPLSSIVGEDPSLGFRRWSFPSGATVTFMTNRTWRKLNIRNASSFPLRIGIVTIHLDEGISSTDSYLLQKMSDLLLSL